jgi:hypothetical protein
MHQRTNFSRRKLQQPLVKYKRYINKLTPTALWFLHFKALECYF